MSLTAAQEIALATCREGRFRQTNIGDPNRARFVGVDDSFRIFFRMNGDPSVLRDGCPADLDLFAFGDLIKGCRGLRRALSTFAWRDELNMQGRGFWRALCWLTDDFKRELEQHVGFEFADTIAPLMDPALYGDAKAAAAPSSVGLSDNSAARGEAIP